MTSSEPLEGQPIPAVFQVFDRGQSVRWHVHVRIRGALDWEHKHELIGIRARSRSENTLEALPAAT